MGIYDIVFVVCCAACLTSATNIGSMYTSMTCMSVLTVTSHLPAVTLTQCAVQSHIESQKAFSFDFTTGECRIIIEDPNTSSTCSVGSDQQYFKIKERALPNTVGPDKCPVPIPSGYTLEYPHYGDTDLARYTCISFTDKPPVDSCPVVKCAVHLNYTDSPASCSVKDVFNSSAMEMDEYEYEGRVSCTLKGTVCQRWDTDFPHSPSYYRDRSDYGNSCKIGNEHRPWCYTTDPNDRWDYCPVEDLDCGAPPIISPSNTGVKIEIKWPDMGSKAQVLYQCESLIAADPDQHCPVARCEGDLNWSEANVSCSVNDCYVHDDSYTGRVSCTITGHPCQRWDSDEPHSHSILEGRSDLENWCQIDGEDKPWCYTTSTRVRWDYCPVRECP